MLINSHVGRTILVFGRLEDANDTRHKAALLFSVGALYFGYHFYAVVVTSRLAILYRLHECIIARFILA